MASSNIHMPPLFAPASGANAKSDWGEVDTFDVDMLAEYLLDDGNLTAGGVTFDFNIDHTNNDSTMVSPENSEDGNQPPVADGGTQPSVQQLLTQMAAQQAVARSVVPTIAPGQATPTAALGVYAPLGGQQLQTLGINAPVAAQILMQQQQQQQAANAAGNVRKRRRVENFAPGVMNIAALNAAAAAGVLNGPQLAEAAAQAMDQQGRGRKKSQAQVDRRRERNRILARRTRLRKKFFFESLQKEVMDLQVENLRLKEIVKTNIEGEEGKKILDSCDAEEKMPPGVLEACGEERAEMDAQDFSLVKSIQSSQHSFIITDPSLADNPIVFASDDFLNLTGYAREQVLGRNCRFLQGDDTSKESIDTIRKALTAGEDVSVTLVNYMADGTPFWNKLFVAALRDAQNNIVNFIGVTVKVAYPEPGHPQHGKSVKKTEGTAENTIMAIEDSVSAAVAAAGH